jgi:hypothetical protein
MGNRQGMSLEVRAGVLAEGGGGLQRAYSFTTSSWDFFGRISSMCGVSRG